MKNRKKFEENLSALRLSDAADIVIEDLADDFETIDEMMTLEEVEVKTANFFYGSGEAFQYLSTYDITDWDDAIDEGCTDVTSIAVYYLQDEVMIGLAKLKKTMGGKNNG